MAKLKYKIMNEYSYQCQCGKALTCVYTTYVIIFICFDCEKVYEHDKIDHLVELIRKIGSPNATHSS